MDDFEIVPENDSTDGDWLLATASICLSGIATGLSMTGSILGLSNLSKPFNWVSLGISIAEFLVYLWASTRHFFLTAPEGDPNKESTYRTWRVNIIHIFFALGSGIASLAVGILNMTMVPILGDLPGGLQIASFAIELVASYLAFYFREYWLDYDLDMEMADSDFDIFATDFNGYSPLISDMEQERNDANVRQYFPNAMRNDDLFKAVRYIAETEGLTADNTLFSHSLCPDEINHEEGDISE